jgi:hypothetical protein
VTGALKLFKIAHNELDATICEGTRRVGESRCIDWIKPVRGLLTEVPSLAVLPEHERKPCVPAVRPIGIVEFLVGLQVQIALRCGADGNDEADLRPNSHHARFETADPIACSAVATDPVVDIADEPDLKLLGQELRRAPVEMHVDAVLVLGGTIDHVVGEAKYAGEFTAGLLIETSVAEASVDRPVADADIGHPSRVTGTERDVSGDVGHVVVHARVSAQKHLWIEVAESRY